MTATDPSWPTAERRGAASLFHALEPAAVRAASWLDVDAPALVLGSAQPASVVDRAACAAAGVEVVRRRSGGGAVLLMPARCAWLDVVVPRDDVLWHDDVGRSMWWLGEVWAEALVALGCVGVDVHRGPVRRTAWSSLVCFDGLGAGEVTIGGRKVVGISQRRTRHWARLQSSVHLGEPTPAPSALIVPLLSPPRPTAAELLPPVVLPFGVVPLRRAVQDALERR